MSTPETFESWQVEHAIEQWLDYGENTCSEHADIGKGHRGYFAGNGWAARCLRWHLEQLKARSAAPMAPSSHSSTSPSR